MILSAPAGSRAAAPPGEETLAAYPWQGNSMQFSTPELAGRVQVVEPSADAVAAGIRGPLLRITNPDDKPLRVPRLVVNAPPVTADFYALNGQVRYEDVSGDGFLEMWSTFPPAVAGGGKRSWFSRTLGETDTDPMMRLRGTSGWRPVILPFNAAGLGGHADSGNNGAHPVQLTVNLVLPSHGTVTLSTLRLAQYRYGAGAGGLNTWPAALRAHWLPVALGAAVLLAAVAGWSLRIRRARQRRAAEWRRMAAQDTLVG